jgi:hypothetical protein
MPVDAQDPPDGRRAKSIAQVKEFTVHSPISSPGVLSREPGDQFADLVVE